MAREIYIVRVDNWLLFPDGQSRKLTWRERFKLWRGKPLVVHLQSGKPTKHL